MKIFLWIILILAAYCFIGGLVVTLAWPLLKKKGADDPKPFFAFWLFGLIAVLLAGMIKLGSHITKFIRSKVNGE